MIKRIVIAAIVFVACFLLWSNFIHEPLHLVALKLQGSDGYIERSYGIGATPHTVRTAPVAGVAGGLFFLLLPSIVTALCLVWAATRKNQLGILGLAVWLGFDLSLNAMQFRSPGNDFHFLIAVPGGRLIAILIAAAAITGVAVAIRKEMGRKNRVNGGSSNKELGVIA